MTELEEAIEQNKNLIRQADHYAKLWNEEHEENKALQKQIKDANSALQYYADEENYTKSGVLVKSSHPEITPDFGERASQYLDKYK